MSSPWSLLGLGALLASACAPHCVEEPAVPAAASPPASGAPAPVPSSAASVPAPPSAPAAPAPAPGTTAPAGTGLAEQAQAASAAPPPPHAPPEGAGLPEVQLSSYGMHIGGGPNDASSKRPLLDALEARFEALRACYGSVEEPAKGGVFGVDLTIPREGGTAQLGQVRTSMKGAEFRGCLLKVLESVRFPRPPRGRTTVSYSVKFQLGR